MEKAQEDRMEDLSNQKVIDEEASTPAPEALTELASQHREYLLQRHGTLELDPVPAMDDADPYNWPTWKVDASPVLLTH
jgi:hypothetical protein